jgi:hypothetical protein
MHPFYGEGILFNFSVFYPRRFHSLRASIDYKVLENLLSLTLYFQSEILVPLDHKQPVA